MTTAIGNRMVGTGIKYHHASGDGMVRNAASNAIGFIGHKLFDAIASKDKGGSGYKLTGGARKKRVGRPRKVGRPKTVTHRKRK